LFESGFFKEGRRWDKTETPVNEIIERKCLPVNGNLLLGKVRNERKFLFS